MGSDMKGSIVGSAMKPDPRQSPVERECGIKRKYGKRRFTGHTHLGGSLKVVLRSKRHREEILVRVDERVSDRRDGWEVDGEGDGGDRLDTRHELVDQRLLLDIQHRGREDRAVIVNLNHDHPVGEGRDVEHVEQRGFGLPDPGSRMDDLHVVHNLDSPPRDLGGDTQSLEERSLSRLHTGVSSWDRDVVGRYCTGTSRSGDLVGEDDLADVFEVPGGEDEADVATDVGEETLKLRVLGHDDSEGAADHRVLAHEDDTFASEGLTDHMELLRGNVVYVDEEDRGYGVVSREYRAGLKTHGTAPSKL